MKPTLRARLTLIYAGLFLLAGILLLAVTYALFSNQLSRDRRVIIQGTYLSPPATGTPTPIPGGGQTPRKDLYVMNSDGDVLTGVDAERVMREQNARVKAAATKTLLAQGSIALVLVGGLATGFGWLVAGRVLAPLHRVTDTARRIAAAPAAGRGLHERIALKGPDDEVKSLADAFDTMVERLDHSFDGQRRFVANASHELRTPLTLGRALVEVAMHRKTASEDLLQLGGTLLEINARHEQLIGGLLLLADSEKQVTATYPVNLADVITHVAAQLTPEADTAGVTLTTDSGDAPTTGDALLLERLVHNLVENGIRHNLADHGWVRVTSRRTDDVAEVEVVNSGPSVPPYEVEALFKPFHRLGADRLVGAKGAGLGLSIVQSVAQAHGGSVRAVPRPDGGLAITVRLPVDPG
ncbi:HAMP domain-containing sensor histidine kinase [Streptomyces sp. SID13031]|uniref:sensor histidine kinase n=1 Tax=Streptomyces sp. SID13031 TaxID=2706046 RepID=UPI0013C6FFF1|nr:HAMP domain-containing sensor histidine kinase [Streptomyces sp. SID13031]NEA36229.1 HAMP domain-containing histidine kinase [Streptomyces sp. SID13031]